MTGSAEVSTNPYIGARAFEEDEHHLFYGREEETTILEGLVMSRRAVLFFAQSGAGKSSLLKAGLMPELTRQETVGRGRYQHTYQKMRVLPVLSVGGAIPGDLDAPVGNAFVFSALFSLNPESDPAEISGLSFSEGLTPYFQKHEEGEAGNSPNLSESSTVVIFDQFEELFTHHLDRWQEREDFFLQVSQSLETYPNLHVLISMREDHIAELTPYAHLLPEQLRPRFRMERLKREAALQAVIEPAKKAGRTFAEGVAEALVDNLRRTQPGRDIAKEASADPAEKTSLGEFVEPVHLQLVCRQLWQKLPPERREIEAGDVQDFGDVDKALTDFYETTIAAVLAQTNLSERRLRAWFDRKLITPARTRGLVYRDETETDDLPNEAVDILNEAYIIRATTRGRDIWYELAHDRLVEPILASNQAWLTNYHNPITIARRAWMEAGEDPNKLLKGDSLTAAEEYAAKNPGDILPEEKEFLAKSQQLREQRSAKQRRILAILAAVAIVILGGLTTWALVERSNATANAAEARDNAATATANLATAVRAQGTAAAAQGTAEADREVARISEAEANDKSATATASLATAVVAEAAAREAQGKAEAEGERANQLAKIADSRRLAALAQSYLGEDARLALLLSVEALTIQDTAEARSALLSGIQQKLERVLSQTAPVLPLQNYRGAKAVAFSPDGEQVAIGTRQGPVLMWRTGDQEGLSTSRGHQWEVLSAGFSPDGSVLATGDFKANIILWDTQSGQEIGRFTANDWVLSLDFNPKNKNILASGGSGVNKRVFLWDVSDQENPVMVRLLNDPKDDVRMVRWSPDGELIAGGGEKNDLAVWVWNAETGEALRRMTGHPAPIWSIAWSPDGNRLASGDQEGNIYLWDYASGTRENNFRANRTEVIGLTFSPDGNTLAAVDGSGTLSIWDVGRNVPVQDPLQSTRITQAQVISADFSTGSDQLVLGSSGDNASIWRLALQQPVRKPLEVAVEGAVQSIQFLDEVNFSITANTGIRVNLWRGDNAKLEFISGKSGNYPSSAIYPDGGHYAVGRENGDVEIFEGDTGQIVTSFNYFNEPVLSLAVNSEASLLAFGVQSGEIMLWDLLANQRASQITLPGFSQAALSLAFSPEGKYLASGYQDGSIILWELKGESIQGSLPLLGSRAGISALAFSQDRKTLASGSPDRTIQLWDVESRQSIGGPLSGSIGTVSGLAFNPDGTALIAGEANGSLASWDTDLDSWISRACELARKALEKREWDQFFPNVEYQPACQK
jgi:WD40 repeat protein